MQNVVVAQDKATSLRGHKACFVIGCEEERRSGEDLLFRGSDKGFIVFKGSGEKIGGELEVLTAFDLADIEGVFARFIVYYTQIRAVIAFIIVYAVNGSG